MSESLSPTEAVRVLRDASRYEDNLVQRTEGLTAIIWGLVTPGIFATYALGAETNGLTPLVASTLWIPWVTAGMVATFALWRSAALSRPEIGRDSSVLNILVKFVVGLALYSVVFFVVRPTSATAPMIIVGGMWLLMAFANPYRSSSRGRAVWGASGAALALAGAALLLLGADDAVSGIASLVVSGVVPLALGTWQTLQG